ncbi:MAG: acyl carrier protein [Acidimicrobiales bacterium]
MPEAVTRAEIFETIRGHLADILEIDPAKITESASFSEDLNADSLALIELVEAIEDEFSKGDTVFRIEDEELEELKTMRDAVTYVADKLNV